MAEYVVEQAEAVIHEHEGLCSCGHDSSAEHNSNGCYARISYEPLTTCDCTLDHGDGTSAVVVARALAAANLLASPDAIRQAKAEAWDEGFDRGFYDPLAGDGRSGRDASESAAKNPYADRIGGE